MSNPRLRDDPEYRERAADPGVGAMPPVDRSMWLVPLLIAAIAALAILFFALGRDNHTTAVPPEATTGQTAPVTTPGNPGTPPRP
jgi:hypothetical protein